MDKKTDCSPIGRRKKVDDHGETTLMKSWKDGYWKIKNGTTRKMESLVQIGKHRTPKIHFIHTPFTQPLRDVGSVIRNNNETGKPADIIKYEGILMTIDENRQTSARRVQCFLTFRNLLCGITCIGKTYIFFILKKFGRCKRIISCSF